MGITHLAVLDSLGSINDNQRNPSHVELPTGAVMQSALLVERGFEVPPSVAEHPRVGPGCDDLADEQVVRLLVVRLWDHAARQPADPAIYKVQVGGRGAERPPPVGAAVSVGLGWRMGIRIALEKDGYQESVSCGRVSILFDEYLYLSLQGSRDRCTVIRCAYADG